MKQQARQFLVWMWRAMAARPAPAALATEALVEPAATPVIAALPPLQDRENQLARVFQMIENAIARADRAVELQQAAALQIDAAAYALEDLMNELPEGLRPARAATAATAPQMPVAKAAKAAAGYARAA